jgi:hypothetical protein
MNSTLMLRTPLCWPTQHTPQFCVLLDNVTLHWVIYAQQFSAVWWSHLHWTFNPCQWHHHTSKTLCTNHPVIWHNILAEHTNQLCRCWNLKAHKGRPLFTTGLGISCYYQTTGGELFPSTGIWRDWIYYIPRPKIHIVQINQFWFKAHPDDMYVLFGTI